MSPPPPPSPRQNHPPTQTYPAPAPASGDAVPTVPRETLPMPGGAFPPAPPPFVLRSAPRAPVPLPAPAVPVPVVPPPAPKAPAPVVRPLPAPPVAPRVSAPPARTQVPASAPPARTPRRERKPAIYVQRPGPVQRVRSTRGNVWAVACLLCAVSDVIFFPLFFISAPLGVVSGHLARRASRRDPAVNNRLMTTISLVVNYLFLLGGVIAVLAFLLALV